MHLHGVDQPRAQRVGGARVGRAADRGAHRERVAVARGVGEGHGPERELVREHAEGPPVDLRAVRAAVEQLGDGEVDDMGTEMTYTGTDTWAASIVYEWP